MHMCINELKQLHLDYIGDRFNGMSATTRVDQADLQYTLLVLCS
jgi:hypothetical protein